MPNYDYICDNCGHTEEVFQKFSDDKLTRCPECGEHAFERQIGTGLNLNRRFFGDGAISRCYSVLPSEVREFSKHCPSGEFHSNGQISFKDRSHERKFKKEWENLGKRVASTQQGA